MSALRQHAVRPGPAAGREPVGIVEKLGSAARGRREGGRIVLRAPRRPARRRAEGRTRPVSPAEERQ